MTNYLDRPRRHRIVAIAWRIAAAILLFGFVRDPDTNLAELFVTIFFLLLATLHDLVAAALQMRTRIEWRTLQEAEQKIDALRSALGALLGDVDFRHGSCTANEAVAVAINPKTLKVCDAAMEATRP